MQSCQLTKSVIEKGQPSLPFSDIISTWSLLSCSSTGILSHTLMLIKSEKGIMNYFSESSALAASTAPANLFFEVMRAPVFAG